MINFKLLLEIIATFAKVNLLSFGGGYVAIPLVEKQVVGFKSWLTYSEFSDLLALDEVTPGPIAINCATFVGMKMHGILGSIAATLGSVLPSVIISLILVKVYSKFKDNTIFQGILKGLKGMVLGLLASTFISLLLNSCFPNNQIDVLAIILTGIALFLFRKYKLSPIIVILICGALGLCTSLIMQVLMI